MAKKLFTVAVFCLVSNVCALAASPFDVAFFDQKYGGPLLTRVQSSTGQMIFDICTPIDKERDCTVF